MLDPAGGGGERAGHQSEQRGLAGPVRTEDPGPFARTDPPGDLTQHLVFVVADGDVLQVHHVLAEPRGGHPGQLQPVAHLRDVRDQGVRGVDAELRLGCAGRGPAA